MGTNPRVRPALAGGCIALVLLLYGGLEQAAAQLPAPPVSSPHAIHLGGYGSVVLGRSTGSATTPQTGITEAAVALLASGTILRRLSYFGEIEAADRTEENWTGRRQQQGLDVERLYAEYAFADAFRLRAGRFLTPIGQWNEIHAEPLTWTALRPLTTYRPFAKSTTGIMAAGAVSVVGHDAGYAIYFSPPHWSREQGQESAFVRALGGRIAAELFPGFVVGASAATFRVSRPYEASDERYGEPSGGEYSGEEQREAEADARGLAGADVGWNLGRVELLSEAVALSGTTTRPAERGAFLQAAIRLWNPLHLVLRTETYRPVYSSPADIQTLGLTLRPFPHATFKLERQFASQPSLRVPDGWFLSASALF